MTTPSVFPAEGFAAGAGAGLAPVPVPKRVLPKRLAAGADTGETAGGAASAGGAADSGATPPNRLAGLGTPPKMEEVAGDFSAKVPTAEIATGMGVAPEEGAGAGAFAAPPKENPPARTWVGAAEAEEAGAGAGAEPPKEKRPGVAAGAPPNSEGAGAVAPKAGAGDVEAVTGAAAPKELATVEVPPAPKLKPPVAGATAGVDAGSGADTDVSTGAGGGTTGALPKAGADEPNEKAGAGAAPVPLDVTRLTFAKGLFGLTAGVAAAKQALAVGRFTLRIFRLASVASSAFCHVPIVSGSSSSCLCTFSEVR